MPYALKTVLAFVALIALSIVYWTAIALSWLLLPIVKLGFAFAAAPRHIKKVAHHLGDWLEGPQPVQPDIWCD